MSKKLYLLRHSYAEEMHGKPDFERSLTMEGLSTIRALGRHLRTESFKPGRLMVSSARRTRETAINLVEELGLNEQSIQYLDELYNASIRELLVAVTNADEIHSSLTLIGHNPAITYFAEYLTNESIGNMEPSSLVTIDFENVKWKEVSQNSGNFVSYFHPNQ